MLYVFIIGQKALLIAQSFVRSLIKLIQDVPAKKKSGPDSFCRDLVNAADHQPILQQNPFADLLSVSAMTCEFSMKISC